MPSDTIRHAEPELPPRLNLRITPMWTSHATLLPMEPKCTWASRTRTYMAIPLPLADQVIRTGNTIPRCCLCDHTCGSYVHDRTPPCGQAYTAYGTPACGVSIPAMYTTHVSSTGYTLHAPLCRLCRVQVHTTRTFMSFMSSTGYTLHAPLRAGCSLCSTCLIFCHNAPCGSLEQLLRDCWLGRVADGCGVREEGLGVRV